MVLIPLLLLGGLEVALRLIGYGYPTQFFLTTRLDGREVVHENQQFGWRFFPAAAARTPRPVVLPRNKPPQTCRIFVFGESAAYGDPAPAFGLPRVLEVLLQSRHPTVQFEVVNVAMTAINSHVILPIAKDCARQEGDVWVVYMGNNEVVGPYGAGTIFGPQVPSRAFIRASHSLNAAKIGQLLASVRESAQRQKAAPLTSVGLELFLDNKLRRDDPKMETVYAHFARNLSEILKTGTDSGAKVVVSTMASNLKDCAPFASLHRPGLSVTEQADWDQHYQAGISAEQTGNFAEAERAYAAAAKIDDQWADLRFRQARLLWKLGGFTAALQHFTLARDLDALRFRADTRINDLIRQIGTNRFSEGIAFLDGHEVLAQLSPHGVLGGEVLYEHVHLNFTGNYHLALALAEQITEVLKPAVLAGQTPASGAWLSAAECAVRLDLHDWDHQRTWELIQQRLAGLPFTLQLDHAAQSARIQAEIARYQQKSADQSIEDRAQRCEQALVARPDDWMLHQKLARLLAPSPAPTLQARAIEAWRRVIALVPHYPEAYYELGVLLDKAGQAHEAETQLRQSLKLKQNYHPNALHALGNLLAGQDRLPEAVAAYEQALQLKPTMSDTAVNLGVALKRLGRVAEAQARFEAALQLPGNHAAAANLGQLLNESGEISSAITLYTEMLRANPKDATAHYNLGRCLGLLNRSSEAQEHYVQALRLRPEMDEAHTQLALELARSGNETAALEHFREAVRLKPDSGEAHKNLGIALARQRRFAEAITEFEAALRLNPGDTATQNFLQAARRSLGSR